MKVQLILVGKTNKSYLKEAEAEYEGRLKHYVSFSEVVIPELKNASKLSVDQIKNKEGDLILSKLVKSDHVVLLDEGGKTYSSVGFSQFLQKKMNAGTKSLVFIVGGAYGFSDTICQRADQKLSLSEMTFSHQMVRTIFKEQLYRAFTILKGEPYHHS